MSGRCQLEKRVEAALRTQRLVIPGDQVAVAVSGGPDSIALLSVLAALRASWDLRLWAVHFDHGLRGVESETDAEFVRDFCHRLGIDVSITKLDLSQSLAREQGFSLQQVARKVRYEALFRLAGEGGATKIAVGHTADDQAETVLMWMIRGSGTGGLCGMPPIRDPLVIRPLLGISREEILAYLASRELHYRIDTSNFKPLYFRNRLRHELIPVLKRYNPNLIKVLARQAEIVREDHAYLEELAAKALHNIKRSHSSDLLILHRESLLAFPLAIRRRVIRLALHTVARMTYGPRFGTVETILDRVVNGQSGSWIVSYGVRITREYEDLLFHFLGSQSPVAPRWTAASQAVDIPSQIIWPLTGQSFAVSLNPVSTARRQKNPFQVKFDAATFSHSLVLRTWQPGDQFCPLGLGGKRKKLKNFFADIKLKRSKREKVPLLVAPEGILWVAGYREDHRFRVTESTREELTVSLSAGSDKK